MTTLVGQAERRVWAAAVAWLADCPVALAAMAEAMADGTWWSQQGGRMAESEGTADVYKLFAELRSEVGVLKAKKKDGVRFKVRSADELADRVRPVADRLGLLIYPVSVSAKGHVVEGGTLAEATITLRVRALSDGSYFDITGFGLGADTQDKAGGKAGTYAWKTALVQALTAGGEKDTDDTDTPIQGGVQPKRAAAPAKPASAVAAVSREAVEAAIAAAVTAKDMAQLRGALVMANGLDTAEQTAVAPLFKAAAAEIRG